MLFRSGKAADQLEAEQAGRFDAQLDPHIHEIPDTNVLEVWFAGCHCDVGGGSVSNDTPHNLARIPLRWMIRQCFLEGTGIQFHTPLLRHVGLDPSSLYPIVKERPAEIYATPENVDSLIQKSIAQHTFYSTRADAHARGASAQDAADQAAASHPLFDPTTPTTPGASPIHERMGTGKAFADSSIDLTALSVAALHLTEEEEDLLDSLCPIYDQLDIAWGWWALELVPFKHRYQEGHGTKWVATRKPNLGRPRRVPPATEDNPLRVHRSVKVRMDAAEKQLVKLDEQGKKKGVRAYQPKPKPKLEEITWVW